MAAARLSVVFMGTPEFSVPSLTRISREGFNILGVVTRPDRPRGRGRKLSPSPVKAKAESLGLEVVQPKSLKEAGFMEWLGRLAPDVLAVVAFGMILTPEVLALPKIYPVNLHASLLPKLRGAAPIQRAILTGMEETGVTAMVMDTGVDTGDILLQEATPIGEETTAGELTDILAERGAGLLVETLRALAEGSLKPTPQDDGLATYAPVLNKKDALIPFSRSAREAANTCRALDPAPGAYALFGEAPLKLFRPKVAEPAGNGPPGAVIAAGPEGLRVAAKDGEVLFRELQMPGKKRLDAAAFFSGTEIPPGTVLKGA
jgi:methionyl-tRNA formyltransferase